MSFITKNFQFIIIIILLISLYFMGGFSKGCGSKHVTADTVYHRDTTFIVNNQQIPVYQPIVIESKIPTIIPQPYQASADIAQLTKQYNELVSKFLTINTYKDSISLKDTSGRSIGVVNLDDKVSENQIKQRNPSYTLRIPVITNTTVITNPYQPVNQAYIGGEITGSPSNYINGINAALILKNKADKMLALKGGFLLNEGKIRPQFGIGLYTKIKLKKQ